MSLLPISKKTIKYGTYVSDPIHTRYLSYSNTTDPIRADGGETIHNDSPEVSAIGLSIAKKLNLKGVF